MRILLGMLLGAVGGSWLLASQAMAGPAFAYSWLTTDKTFAQCISAAEDTVSSLNLPHIQRTRFGVTGETKEITIFINCEDQRHVSLVLIQGARPQNGEIDALVALMQNKLNATKQED